MTPLHPARPVPSKSDVLARLIAHRVSLSEVVDVGVRECTMELIKAFPGHRHHLFEPVNVFFPQIETNYRAVDHKVYPLALSDADADRFLVVSSLKRDGTPTHGAIRDKPVDVDGLSVVSCTSVQIRRFDNLGLDIAKNFLLKIDVDGTELEVLAGFGAALALASVVIVEMTFTTYLARSKYLSERGFQLFDVVDMVYYGPGLYQFDAVFIRGDVAGPNVRPPIAQFESRYWNPFVAE